MATAMFNWKKLPVYLFLFISIGIVSCSTSNNEEEDDGEIIETDQFRIVNSLSTVETRYTEMDEEIPIDTTQGLALSKAARSGVSNPPNFGLRLVSSIIPPTVNGTLVQATMVYNDRRNRAIVSYNTRGAERAGAIDIARINSNGNNIRIRSSVQFFGADVNAVVTDDNRAYTALSTEDARIVEDGEFSAGLSFSYSEFFVVPGSGVFSSLPSFAANSVAIHNNRVYVTSGNAGGLTVFNSNFNQEIGFVSLPEARWVDANDDYLVVLQGDTDNDQMGSIAIIDPSSLQVINEYPFPGAYTPEAKNTVELSGHIAFIAAGKAGVQIMDLTNGNILASIPIPDPASLGLSPDVVTTNAVSADDDILFISNGEAGVYVAELDEDLDDIDVGEDVEVDLIGRLQFNDLQSANHVAYRSRILIVAAGLGGIKTVSLRDL